LDNPAIEGSTVSHVCKIFLLFFIVGLLVFFNSLNNKFLIDDYVFLSNPVLSKVEFIPSQWNPYREQALGVVDSHQTLGYYRPMAHIILDICYGTFKKNCWLYHLFNLILFVFVSLLVYLLIKKITGNEDLALLSGLFYLIHPINGIIVNYISACVFSFQVICTLGSILLLLFSLSKNNNRLLYILSLFLSFLALLWNESGVMTPFYISAVVLFFQSVSLRKKLLYLCPYFLIVFSYLVFRFFFNSINIIILKQVALFHMTGAEFWANLFPVFKWYILQLFYPGGVVMAWTTPILHDHLTGYFSGTCLLLLLSILLFIRFYKNKIILLAVVWLLIGFAPACLAVFKRPDNGAQIEPHWFVVSSIGFFVLVAYSCLYLLGQRKRIGIILLTFLTLLWAMISHANNQLWIDQKTYSLYWSQQVPGLKSTYFYLADAYQKEGDFKDAKYNYRIALAHYTSDLEIYNNIGVMDEQEGDLKGAEYNYKRVLRIYPHSSEAYNNLGALCLKEGQWNKAEEYYHQALAYNPLMLEPRKGLAVIFFNHSDYKKAISLCLINLSIDSGDVGTLSLLLDIYIRQNDDKNIDKYARKVINYTVDPKVLTRVGVVLSQHNATILAMDCFMKVMRLKPDYSDVYLAAGTLLAQIGKYDAAVNIWKIGSSINPADDRFKWDIYKIKRLK
jgi:tetratricopeptide (TPR) repeat protein